MPASWYVETAWKHGCDVDAWETVYEHVLPGSEPVLEWMKGTALRPILKVLDGTLRDEFVAAYAARLRAAFPSTPAGTIFPFSRLFFVAKRR
jgi:trans-aconitate 2-methyltransferase